MLVKAAWTWSCSQKEKSQIKNTTMVKRARFGGRKNKKNWNKLV